MNNNNIMTVIQRGLFGGAITCTIPKDWIDISNIREVPDHQECYYDDKHSNCLFVIEVLQRQNDITDECSAEYFFNDLVEINNKPLQQESKNDNNMATTFLPAQPGNAIVPSTTVVPNLGNRSNDDIVVAMGTGTQTVAIGRYVNVTTGNNNILRKDQVICNTYVYLCVIRLKEQDTDLLITLSGPIDTISNNEYYKQLFQTILKSLQIHDWNLFSG